MPGGAVGRRPTHEKDLAIWCRDSSSWPSIRTPTVRNGHRLLRPSRFLTGAVRINATPPQNWITTA